MRKAFVLIHRYAGLYMALFLIVAGLTGSILAFDGEIRDWLNPPPRVAVRAQPMLDAVALRERALALAPQGQITWLSFRRKPGEAYTVTIESRTDPATGQPYALPFNTLTLDPYTGNEIGRSQRPEGLWHMATVWGLPFKIFLCVTGLVIVALSVTGVVIWWRRRRSMHHQRERRVQAASARAPAFVDQR